MMKESKAVTGVLNDWDHAGPKDELSRGIVSLISYQDRSQRPTSVIIGHMGVHVRSISEIPAQASRSQRRLREYRTRR